MKYSTLAQLVLSLAFVDSTASSGGAGPIVPPPYEGTLDVRVDFCKMLSDYSDEMIAGMMQLVNLSARRNWEEMTGAPTKEIYRGRGAILCGKHVRELLMPHWDWDTRGTAAETPKSRLE
jgi:hypothetical protein